MYDTMQDGSEGLTPWQLINRLYLKVERDISSVSASALVDSHSLTPSERVRTLQFQLKKKMELDDIFVFLRSLLTPGTDFSENMSDLYDWFLENLKTLTSDASTFEQKKQASANLAEQSKGFLIIWKDFPQFSPNA